MLCGATDTPEVQRGVRYEPGAAVRRCAVCSLVFLWPRPTPEELAIYYTVAYRKEYHGTISPADTYRETLMEARERVRRLLPSLTPETCVLEIGASAGAFLESVRPYVKSTVGVEPDEAHREWARATLALDMVPALTQVGAQCFDLIVLFHTLEHMPDPVSFLRSLAGYLAPGGKMVIEVPNVTDALLSLYQVPAFANFYYQRAHLYYFSAETLSRTIQAAGGSSEITGVQRYDLSNHLRWMVTGQPGGQGYYREVLTGVVQEAYAEALIRAGYADTLWAVATFEAGDARQ